MDALSRNWGWLLALGILMIILGLMAIAAPVYATFAVQALLGWILIIGGIAQGVHAFMAKGSGGFLFGSIHVAGTLRPSLIMAQYAACFSIDWNVKGLFIRYTSFINATFFSHSRGW